MFLSIILTLWNLLPFERVFAKFAFQNSEHREVKDSLLLEVAFHPTTKL